MNLNLVVFTLLFTSIHCCHYTCSLCNGGSYIQCAQCLDGSGLTILNGKSAPYSRLEDAPLGICSNGGFFSGVNALGIFLLVILILLCVFAKNEEVFYLALTYQSLGLISLVQVNWRTNEGYIFDAFSYLMIFSKIGSTYKQVDSQFYLQNIYKSPSFFHTNNYYLNISIIGFILAIVCMGLILIPIFKVIRKKFNQERYNFLPSPKIDKIVTVLEVVFLFTAQEMSLIIFLSYKYGGIDPVGIAASVIYFLLYCFFFVNAIYYPFNFFRSKLAQAFSILKRVIPTTFIILGANNHYVLLIFLIAFSILDLILTHKNRNIRQRNTILIYRIFQISLLTFIVVQYAVELTINRNKVSEVLGIICTIFLAIFMYPILLESLMFFKQFDCFKRFQSTFAEKNEEQNKKVNSQITQIQLGVSQTGANNPQLMIVPSYKTPIKMLQQNSVQIDPNSIFISDEFIQKIVKFQPDETLNAGECAQVKISNVYQVNAVPALQKNDNLKEKVPITLKNSKRRSAKREMDQSEVIFNEDLKAERRKKRTSNGH